MIAQIIPNIRMPRRGKFFDYRVVGDMAKIIKPGMLVKIPFRQKVITGVVYSISKTSQFSNLKEVVEIIDENILLPWHLKLINWFADYYATSLSLALYTFLPEKPKRNIKYKKHIPQSTIKYNFKNNLSASKTLFSKNTLLNLQDYEDRLDYLYSEISNAINSKARIVIFFPTVDELLQFYNALSIKEKNNIIIVTAGLSRSQNWYIWNSIKKNNFIIVFSTRMGVFLPFDGQTRIIVDQAERLEYKQTDMNPRYHLLDILQQRRYFFSKQIYVYTSFFPSVELFTSVKKEKFFITKTQKPLHNKLRLIERNSLKSRIEASISFIKNNENTLIFLNRKGLFTTFQCNDCGWVSYCPIDKQPLKLHNSRFELQCHDCSHTEPAPNKCPKCSGVNILGVGIGTSNIGKIFKNKFPKHTVIRLDSDSQISSINFNKPVIVIGTQYALTKIPINLFSNILFFNSDADLFFSDFKSLERSLQLYHWIIRQSSADVEIIINTMQSEHEFWQVLAKPYSYFWKQEIKIRKQFLYPPYVKLTKLLYADTDEKHLVKTTNAMFEKLSKSLPKDYVVLPPQKNRPYREYKKYYKYILIKAHTDSLQAVLDKLDDKWLIDRDPQKL